MGSRQHRQNNIQLQIVKWCSLAYIKNKHKDNYVDAQHHKALKLNISW
jgi:hypothetical protein